MNKIILIILVIFLAGCGVTNYSFNTEQIGTWYRNHKYHAKWTGLKSTNVSGKINASASGKTNQSNITTTIYTEPRHVGLKLYWVRNGEGGGHMELAVTDSVHNKAYFNSTSALKVIEFKNPFRPNKGISSTKKAFTYKAFTHIDLDMSFSCDSTFTPQNEEYVYCTLIQKNGHKIALQFRTDGIYKTARKLAGCSQ
ncbi:MAG TPA: hypothetical protein VE868_04250 [Balneolaceae bacterium]|nr:hypothetical protein [Balneolaceae bacterium]